jgi:hypothetical protein
VIWRSAIVASYAALAIVVGIAYGARGLLILSFFYFWAGVWIAFVLVWGQAARAAGRWNFRRLDGWGQVVRSSTWPPALHRKT